MYCKIVQKEHQRAYLSAINIPSSSSIHNPESSFNGIRFH